MNPMTRLPVVAALIGLLLSNNALFADQDLQVAVEVRFISVSDNYFERIGVDFDIPGSSSFGDTANTPFNPSSFFAPVGGFGAGVLSDSQFQTVIRAVEQEGSSDLLSAPRVTSRNGQPVRIDPPSSTPDSPLPFPNLQITPTIGADGAIEMNIGGGSDSFFNPFERTFDIFSGAALGYMSQTMTRTHTHQEIITTEREESVHRIVGYQPYFDGFGWRDVPVYQRQRVVTQQEETVTRVETEEFMRGSFQDQATIYGMRCACFCGLYFGMGGLVQYMDGDLHGAWMGELQGIARYPFEFPTWAFAPYVVTGVGVFLGTDNYPTFSLGGGIEIRPTPNVGFFTEARQTWTDNSDMNFTNVIGGVRFVTDGPGLGLRRVRTNVSVDDGQTVVLGGLLNNSVGTKTDKLPFLGNLPFLGDLFRNKKSDRVKDNLLIFVTPSIVKEG